MAKQVEKQRKKRTLNIMFMRLFKFKLNLIKFEQFPTHAKGILVYHRPLTLSD